MILFQSSRAGRTLKVVPPNLSSQGPSSFTDCMKASVTSTERLNMRKRPGSCFASMKASMSGWSQRKVAIIAPRR